MNTSHRVKAAKAVLEANGATNFEYFSIPEARGFRWVLDGFVFTIKGHRLRASYTTKHYGCLNRWVVFFDLEDTPREFLPFCARLEAELNKDATP